MQENHIVLEYDQDGFPYKGTKIRIARLKESWTIKDLAESVGLSEEELTKIELNQAQLDPVVCNAIADVLDKDARLCMGRIHPRLTPAVKDKRVPESRKELIEDKLLAEMTQVRMVLEEIRDLLKGQK